MTPPGKPIRRSLWIMAAIAFVAASALVVGTRSSFGPAEFWLGDEYVKLRQAAAILRLGYTPIVPPATEPWVFELDRAGLWALQPPWVQQVGGVPQWGTPLVFPAIVAGAWTLFGAPGWLVVTLSGLLAHLGLGIHGLRRVHDARVRWLTAIGAVMATPIVVNGAFVSEHTLATALVHAGVVLLLREPPTLGRWRGDVAAGLSLAAAGWLRPEALVLGGLVVGAMVARRRPVERAALAVAWVAGVGAFFAHNAWLHGAPLGTHALQMAQRAVIPLGDRALRLWSELGWAMPETVVGVLATVLLWGRRRAATAVEVEAGRLLVAGWAFAVALPLFVPNAGGVTWGPRYLFVLAPVLLQAWCVAAIELRWPERPVPRGLALGLALAWCTFHVGFTYVYAPIRVPRVAHHQSAVCGPLQTYEPRAIAVSNLHYLNHVQGCGAGPVFYTPTDAAVSRVLSACVSDCAFAWVTPAVDSALPEAFALRSSEGALYTCRNYGSYGMSNLSLCERDGMVRPDRR